MQKSMISSIYQSKTSLQSLPNGTVAQGMLSWCRQKSARNFPAFTAIFFLAVMELPCPHLLQAEDDDSMYWKSTLEQLEEVVPSRNDRISWNDLKIGEKLRANVIDRLQRNPKFAQLVRQSLRRDERVWVRAFSASMLLKAFGDQSGPDVVYILSDPNGDVRGFGVIGAWVYEMHTVESSLPVGLLSENEDERLITLRGLKVLLGPKALPYYSVLINDKNPDIAKEAARGLGGCGRENAILHLFRYLKNYLNGNGSDAIAREVVLSLYKVFDEEAPTDWDTVQSAQTWIKRLRTEIVISDEKP